MNLNRGWKKALIFFIFTFCSGPFWGAFSALSPHTQPPHIGVLREHLERLKTLGSVLYVGAHPDDENTALLSYLVHKRHVRVAYLSMTRGDGGQNLIGREKGMYLGLIRTYELLSARAIDGATQYFTRAVDFGYSKSMDETLALWGEEEILHDIVRIIRVFQPDIIITRFPPHHYKGHGHHQASALLALKAFRMAGDPKVFPEHIAEGLKPWQAQRILWNAWRLRGREMDHPQEFRMNIQSYFPFPGMTTAELSAFSRSMHRSQGFGSGVRRGPWIERFQLLDGVPFKNDIFEGIDLSWNRIDGGEHIQQLIQDLVKQFNPDNPSLLIPGLLKLYSMLGTLPQSPFIHAKQQEVLHLIQESAGLFIEAVTDSPFAVPGEPVGVTLGIENRGDQSVRIRSYQIIPFEHTSQPFDKSIEPGEYVTRKIILELPSTLPVTEPYWLEHPPKKGRYDIRDLTLLHFPVRPPTFRVRIDFLIYGQKITLETPLTYRWVDPVLGERRRNVVRAPRVVVHTPLEVVYFGQHEMKELSFQIEPSGSVHEVDIQPHIDDPSWKVKPSHKQLSFEKGSESKSVTFQISPSKEPSMTELMLFSRQQKSQPLRGRVTIDYPHIPVLDVFPELKIRLIRLNVTRNKKLIGYIMGSGDDIPIYLRQLGYDVVLLSDVDLLNGDLSQYEALIAGIRAYNTRKVFARAADRFMEYIFDGGTYIVQYSTKRGLVTDHIGPYPFQISRMRITDETAPMKFIIPDHPVLQRPHLIREHDFQGWVQERGLYFAGSWDSRYETPLAGHDPGEEDARGALLFTRFGKGIFIYTGLAFFRQIPAGVPGACRLFINLVEAHQ